MREQETELVNCIRFLNVMRFNWKADIGAVRTQVMQAFEMLQGEPLGMVSLEFLKDPAVISFIQSIYGSTLKLWYLMQTKELDILENEINELITKYREELKLGSSS